MDSAVQTINNLTIGFTSQKGKQISILKNISTTIKKGETVECFFLNQPNKFLL